MNKVEKRMSPSKLFTVPEGIRLLTFDQIVLLEQSFDSWRDAAVRADHMLSRERIRLVFLLLRHTGARLGEVLGLNDEIDLNMEQAVVRLGKNGAKREVPLPLKLNRDLRRVLQGPLAAGSNGHFLHSDQGFVRRAFYARADACGVPRELATARVLRNFRAVEMLRSGVPLSVVQNVLGQSSPELTVVLQHFSNQDTTSIVRRLTMDDLSERTSARNSFAGRVTSIIKDQVMAEVLMQTEHGQDLCAVITTESLHALGLESGSPVTATIKAPLVAVHSCVPCSQDSRRNRLQGTISAVRTTPVITEISAQTCHGQNLCALVSTCTAHHLNLKSGDCAQFSFKGLSVVLNTL
jgi:molybdate transport system regulatory protein